jgi:pimeloyl-ACP methyl ester carboxylesterase
MLFQRRLMVLFSLVLALSLGACTGPGGGADEVKSADGTTIKYEQAGKGDVSLVFIHCWACDRTIWDAQHKFFRPDYHVVRLDLAGHGESGKERKEYTMASYAADVAAVVNKLNLQHVILVGHAMGGPVALETAKLLGDRVVGIIAVDSFYTAFNVPADQKAAAEAKAKFLQPFEPNFPEAAEKMVRSSFAEGANTAVVDRVAKKVASADKGVALNSMSHLFDWWSNQRDASLKQFESKLVNINGDPKSEGQVQHKSVKLIPGTMHYPAQEKPEGFNRVVDLTVQDFLFDMYNKK